MALPVVCESDFSEVLQVHKTDFSAKMGASVAAATAGERKGINGLLEVIESIDTVLEKSWLSARENLCWLWGD